jgi:hypothetical protein
MENKLTLISTFSFLLSLIFLLVQGIINYYFFYGGNSITERILYEQFSYEVYSSIGTPLYSSYNLRENCENWEEPLQFNLNLDTFFDCRNIHSRQLKDVCRNTIVHNYTSCSKDSEDEYVNFNNLANLVNIDEILRFCPYFSKFTQKVSKFYNKKICKSKNNYYHYEDLLKLIKKNENDQECPDGSQCGILDTLNNILCLPSGFGTYPIYEIEKSSNEITIKNNDCYRYSKPIITFILSENTPLVHEWDKMIKETYENIDEKDIEKRRNVVNKQFIDLLNKETDDTFSRKDGLFNLSVIYNENHIKNFDRRKYNLDQQLTLFTRNYIGFRNIDELNKFKKIFNDQDERDNPLYKLSSPGHEPLITIIFSCIFILVSVLYFLVKQKLFLPENIINKLLETIKYIFIIINFLCFIAGLIIMIYHFCKYSPIKIDMDERMKAVLDLYNKRTLWFQLFRIISLFFNLISIILIIIIKIKF